MTQSAVTAGTGSLPSTAPNASAQVIHLPGGRLLDLAQPRLMGVLNITPDSFSDGGRHLDPQAALERAFQMIGEGADLIDLGAESTRPGGGVYGEGATGVAPREEMQRLRPVLAALRRATDIPLSIDTRKASVAAMAIDLGADLINDVSSLGDPEMAGLIAASEVALILMHSRGELPSMQRAIRFDDVAENVRDELLERVCEAEAAGISRQRLIVDPGIGFGKTAQQSLELISRLGILVDTGLPVLLGASRKSFLAAVSGHSPTGLPADDRLAGSLAAAARGVEEGAAILRVHDVAATRQFLDTWRVLSEGTRA